VSEAVVKQAPPPPRAKIYDLGYKRYYGGRRSQATRWQVITFDQVRQAWKKFWRFKAWIALSAVITAIVCAALVFTGSDRFGELERGGVLVRMIDELIFQAIPYLTGVCWILTMAVGCGVITKDLRAGAFTFYFARPVRPLDYVLGKLAALTALQAAVVLVPLLIIAGTRVGLSENRTEMMENLAYVPKALCVGGLAALVYASLSLAFSSFFQKLWLNIMAWCVWYLLITSFIAGIAMTQGAPEIACIDPGLAIKALALDLYDFHLPPDEKLEFPGGTAASVGLALNIVLGVVVSYLRVRNAGKIGGSS
jgi:ABC-type transport system involved in multi-copper enzyme maturation permease subunit